MFEYIHRFISDLCPMAVHEFGNSQITQTKTNPVLGSLSINEYLVSHSLCSTSTYFYALQHDAITEQAFSPAIIKKINHQYMHCVCVCSCVQNDMPRKEHVED